MTSRALQDIVTRTLASLAPTSDELRAAMQSANCTMAEWTPKLHTVSEVHAYLTHLEGVRRYALMLCNAITREAA